MKREPRLKNNVGEKYLFVDGTNLYAGQYSLFGPSKYLVFSKFVKTIEKGLAKKFDRIYFYASYSIRHKRLTRKEKIYLRNEDFFYKSVKNTPKTTFFKGYQSKTSGKEKVVDVKLASDLVAYAIVGKYKEAHLLTGDADFLEALFNARKHSKGVKFNILCLENKIMYRGSYHFPTFVFQFTKRKLSIDTRFYKLIQTDAGSLLADTEV